MQINMDFADWVHTAENSAKEHERMIDHVERAISRALDQMKHLERLNLVYDDHGMPMAEHLELFAQHRALVKVSTRLQGWWHRAQGHTERAHIDRGA